MSTQTTITIKINYPTPWMNPAHDDRQSWFGELRKHDKSRGCSWEVAGSLLDDWNNRVHPVLLTLIEHNYKKIFKKNGRHVMYLQLYLLASAEDRKIACPTIVILSQDKSSAKRARKLISDHELFKQLNTGYDITCEKMAIVYCAGNTILKTEVKTESWKSVAPYEDIMNLWRTVKDEDTDVKQPDQNVPLCGVCIRVAALPLTSTTIWRRATITCTIRVGSTLFAILPSHVFQPIEINPDAAWADDTSNSNCSSDLVSTDDSDSDNDSHFSSSQNYLGPLTGQNGLQVSHGVYIDSGKFKNVASKSGTSIDSDVDRMLHICNVHPGEKTLEDNTAIMIDDNLDFTMVRLEHTRFGGDNQILLPSGITLNVERVSENYELPTDQVIIASGVSGIRQTTMSNTKGMLLCPWSNKPQRVWEIAFTLLPGDSGAPVVSSSGVLLGMAFASVAEKNITFVMPAADMYRSIRERSNMTISMPTMNDTINKMMDNISEAFQNKASVMPAMKSTKVTNILEMSTASQSIPITNQVIARRKRASKPKIRSGCITCRIRHVKCDENKPSCNRCISTGRKCDGYTEPLPKIGTLSAVTESRYAQSTQELDWCQYMKTSVLPAIMGESEADFWNVFVLEAAAKEPVIRSAVVALAALYMAYRQLEGAHITMDISQPDYQRALMLYGRSLRQLNEVLTERSDVKDDFKIFVCSMLFTCFEVLRRNEQTGLVHHKAGMRELFRRMHIQDSDINSDENATRLSRGARFEAVLRPFAHFDIQQCTLGRRGLEPLEIVLPAFRSDMPLTEMRVSLDSILISAYQLILGSDIPTRYVGQDKIPLAWQASRAAHLHSFSEWQNVINFILDNTSDRSPVYEALQSPEISSPEVIGLALQFMTANILLTASVEPEETHFDAYLERFKQMLEAVERYTGSSNFVGPQNVPFTMRLGFVYPLFIIATKCRNHRIRGKAIKQLRLMGREGVWDGPVMAVLAKRMRSIEERADDDPRNLVPERNRIHRVLMVIDWDNRKINAEFTLAVDGTWREWENIRDVIPL